MQKLDILIPVKNEADNVPELVARVHKSLGQNTIKYRLIFIDDHSTDGTVKILHSLAKKFPITVLVKKGKVGKAYSIFEGAQVATSEYVAMIDGDLQYPPEAIPQMLKLVPGHGVVVANRRHQHTSTIRQFVSHANRTLMGKFLLGIGCDVQSGLKIFRRDLLKHLNFSEITAWSLDMPLLHTASELGYKIGTVDIEFHRRKAGNSKLSLIKGTQQIGLSALKLKLTPSRVYTLGAQKASSRGCGIVHKRKSYITHSRLHSSFSAFRTLVPWQKAAIFLTLATLGYGFIRSPLQTGIITIAILSVIYFADVLFNFFLILKSLRMPPELSFSQKQLASLKEAKLPVYTILCPLYKEAAVLQEFIDSINKIEWPKDKLQVLLLLEEDDQETIAVTEKMRLPKYITPVVVPHSHPKTKPKACNYGLTMARGEYIVIFDAEDRPDPLQLKKAYLGFATSSPETICFQAKLNYYNTHHNLLTRLFTAEYSLWFDMVLPGLQSIHTALPLGGTSNHFRTRILKELHGWDAFNVTEDCDLGARLFRNGYRTSMIDSITLEEANSRWGNWLRQRSRWIKGYIQTYLVHNRHPLQFIQHHGIHAFIFQLTVGGKIAFMLINPILWLATISYFALYPVVGTTIERLYPPTIFYLASISLVFGNFLFLYYYMIGCAKRGQWSLVKYIFLIPLYWLMVSLAAVKAVFQLVFRPHYWEKTVHGLHKPAPKAAPAGKVPAVSPGWRLPLPSPALATAGGLMILVTMLVNGMNFIYNAYLGRALGMDEYALIGFMGSLLYISFLPVSGINGTVTYRSGYILGKYKTVAGDFWHYVRRRVLLISLVFTCLWLIASPALSSYFQADLLAFVIFSPIWILGLTGAVDVGFLSGSLRFPVLALMLLTEGVAKLGIAVGLVNVGLGNYAYISTPIAMMVSFLLGWYASARLKKREQIPGRSMPLTFPMKYFSTTVLTRVSAVAFLSLDVVLAKHFLPADQAGAYALLSLVGKMVYFAGSLFSQFIIPITSHAEGAGKNSRRSIYPLLAATALSGFICYLLLGVFSRYTVPLLLGPAAKSIIPYLNLYTLAMALFTLAIAVVNFHQARKQYIFSVVSIVFAGLLILGFTLFHENIYSLTRVITIVGIAYFVTVSGLHLLYEQIQSLLLNLYSFLGLFKPVSETNGASREKLKILIFNWRDTRHAWAGGAEVYIHELARRWTRDGHRVTVFCGNDGRSSRYENVQGVEVYRRGGTYLVYIWAFLYYILKFRGRYDLIIDSENGIPFFTPLFVEKPVFLLMHHVHQQLFREHQPFPISQIGMFLESKAMPWVYRNTKVITVSESSRQDIINLGLFHPENISIVNPGVELEQFTALSPKTTFPSFLYLGRIRPYKNVDIAIRAFAQVLTKYPKSRLYVAGWGESIPDLKKLTEELGVSSSVFFTGKVSEKEKCRLLSQSWVMLQPSSFEGWGITVIEANACGTPVIASDTTGLRDSVVNGKTGELVLPGKISEFASAMQHLIGSRKYREYLSSQARVWALSFDWEAKAKALLMVVRESLNVEPSSEISVQPALLGEDIL